MRSTKVEQKTYPVHDGGKRILTALLLFASCLMILTGLLRGNNDGLTLKAQVTPTPTAITTAFDETPDSRTISLAATSWYAIQLGAYENEASAKAQAASYATRGAAGYVRSDGRFRVLAALYPTKEDAQTVRQQLKTQHDIDSYVYEITLPAVTLKVDGKAGQLDVLEASLQFLGTALSGFCEISVSLDRRELNMEDELAKLNALSGQAGTLSQTLSQRLPATGYKAVEELTGLLTQVSTACQAVSGLSSQGTVAMAATMKYQAISLLCAVEKYFMALNG